MDVVLHSLARDREQGSVGGLVRKRGHVSDDGTHVIAISGGKDSSAMALALKDREPREYVYLCTPTGNELPELSEHWARLEVLLGSPIQRVSNRDLDFWINEHNALPNFRMRWCTRLLKIEPCAAFLKSLPQPVTLYVGLRADEPTREGVIYGGLVTERYPLREWGWAVADVVGYLKHRDITVPARTDCAWCYHQRIEDWWRLWRDHPAEFQRGIDTEARIGHTFRSPGRDTWPSDLAGLRAEFERGRTPKSVKTQLPMFDDQEAPCRVCSL